MQLRTNQPPPHFLYPTLMFIPASVCGVTHHHKYDPPLNQRHLAMLGVTPWTTNNYKHGFGEPM
eukprot:9813114-Karenia_brevis.AAC.1